MNVTWRRDAGQSSPDALCDLDSRCVVPRWMCVGTAGCGSHLDGRAPVSRTDPEGLVGYGASFLHDHVHAHALQRINTLHRWSHRAVADWGVSEGKCLHQMGPWPTVQGAHQAGSRGGHCAPGSGRGGAYSPVQCHRPQACSSKAQRSVATDCDSPGSPSWPGHGGPSGPRGGAVGATGLRRSQLRREGQKGDETVKHICVQ